MTAAARIALVALGVLAGSLLIRFAPNVAAQDQEAGEPVDVIRARRIELIDEDGRTRAQLTVEESGEAVLRIRDPEGTIRVKLGASESGSGLVLLDDRTEPGIHMLANSEGSKITLAERGKPERVIAP
jgi:hypothetical protein